MTNTTSNTNTIQPPPTGHDALADLFNQAVDSGTLSSTISTLLTGDLDPVVIAGAAGIDAVTIQSSDVTLITVLIDASPRAARASSSPSGSSTTSRPSCTATSPSPTRRA